jgi:hypothetical protein
MSRTTFYDDNKNRRYPFVSTQAIEASSDAVYQIPDSALLMCGFTTYAYSGFVAGTSNIWLARISYDSGNLQLEFNSDAPGLVGVPLTFVVPRAAGESVIVFADAIGSGIDAVAGGCVNQLLWLGFAVVGDSEALVAWQTDTPMTLIGEQHTVEPALIQNLDGAYVRSVNLANQRRVQTTDVPGDVRPYLVNSQCLQGPVRFAEGVNCQIDYDIARNGLIFSALVGAGAGETCREIPVIAGEPSPDGGSLLSGGPTCSETIKTINGVGGPIVILRGENVISVARDNIDPHKINVTIDASFLANQGG